MPAPKARPIVTANQVTLGRLALIPFCAYLLFSGHDAQIAAVILGTLIGCTDFVDGYLARKYGTTKLGGLMDPIADKVFTAVVFLPAVDLRWVPAWLVAMLFVREFLVTAARTSYERRGLQLRSSYLSRYKTWVQMCGIGVILFTNILQPSTTRIILGTLAATPIVAWIVLRFFYRRTWRGAGFFALSFSGCLAVHEYFGPHAFALGLMYFVVLVTWASGMGYLTGVGQLKGRGRIELREVARIVTAVTIPVGTVLVEQSGHGFPAATILLLSCELAHGGLDNLLAGQKAESRALLWGGRTLTITGLLAVAYFVPALGMYACALAALIALGGAILAFVSKRRFYLDRFADVGTVEPEEPEVAEGSDNDVVRPL